MERENHFTDLSSSPHGSFDVVRLNGVQSDGDQQTRFEFFERAIRDQQAPNEFLRVSAPESLGKVSQDRDGIAPKV